MKKKNLLFVLVGLTSLATVNIPSVLAWSITLKGEVTDDGGDPYLYVWFEYGLTQSYGYTTPQQTKIGQGEFTYTLDQSQLQMCTTYHYRAVARHQAYDDTKYGQDVTFTTPCSVTVDLKINGSDSPGDISYSQRTITLSWTSSYADNCNAETVSKPSNSNVSWSGNKSTSGSETITLDRPGSYEFRLVCRNNNSKLSASDTVRLNLRAPTLRVVTKGVVVTY